MSPHITTFMTTNGSFEGALELRMHKIGSVRPQGGLGRRVSADPALIGWTDTSPISMTERQS